MLLFGGADVVVGLVRTLCTFTFGFACLNCTNGTSLLCLILNMIATHARRARDECRCARVGNSLRRVKRSDTDTEEEEEEGEEEKEDDDIVIDNTNGMEGVGCLG